MSRRPALALAALALLLASQVSPWWMPTPDSVLYLSVARSVAGGEGLRALGGERIGHPPGYPLLLAPLFLVDDRPFLWISFLHWGLAVALLVGIHRWARTIVPGGALAVTALVAVNLTLWIHLRRTLSEVAFMAVAVWAAVALRNVLDAPEARAALRRSAPAAVLLASAIAVRVSGVFLVLGFLGAAALLAAREPARRRVVVIAGLALAMVPLGLAAAFLLRELGAAPAEGLALGTHLDGLFNRPGDFSDRLLEGVRLRVSEAGRLLVPGMAKSYGEGWLDPNLLVYVPVCAAVAAGWAALARGSADPLLFTLPVAFAAYSVWAFDAGTRYLLPMLPVLWASAWRVLARAGARRTTVLAVAGALHLAVSAGYVATREIPRARACDRDWPAVDRFTEIIRATGNRLTATGPGVPECTRLMLSFALDRRVYAVLAPDPRIAWFVNVAEASPPPGFDIRDRTPNLTLHERSAVAPAR